MNEGDAIVSKWQNASASCACRTLGFCGCWAVTESMPMVHNFAAQAVGIVPYIEALIQGFNPIGRLTGLFQKGACIQAGVKLNVVHTLGVVASPGAQACKQQVANEVDVNPAALVSCSSCISGATKPWLRWQSRGHIARPEKIEHRRRFEWRLVQ